MQRQVGVVRRADIALGDVFFLGIVVVKYFPVRAGKNTFELAPLPLSIQVLQQIKQRRFAVVQAHVVHVVEQERLPQRT